MLLFLDFDGVMHPTGRNRIPFEHLDAFESILRCHPYVHVVISSSWREVHDFEHMREGYFATDIQDRIVGATPIIPGATRWQEVMAYVTDTHYTGPYIVLDDDASEFPDCWEPLLLCASDIGLDVEKQAELVKRLQFHLQSS